MSLIETIGTDLIKAMKAHQPDEVSTLRLLKHSLSNAQIENHQELSEDQVLSVIKKQVKDRKESIKIYTEVNKLEMAQKEQIELDILSKYLPEELSDDKIIPVIDKIISEIKPNGMADFGKVMGPVMTQLKGQVDGARLSDLIKQRLA